MPTRLHMVLPNHTYQRKKAMSMLRSRRFAMTLVIGLGTGISSVAFAHVDVGVNIGVPGVVYAEPPPVVVVSPGWYGARYYDGHRYWERQEWEERHRGGREWHDARDYRGGPRGDWGHDHDGGGPRGDWHHDHEHDGGHGDH